MNDKGNDKILFLVIYHLNNLDLQGNNVNRFQGTIYFKKFA